MFRNLRFFRVSTPWPESEQALSEVLATNEFKPCGSFTEKSAGWESIAPGDDQLLSRRVNGADLIELRTQSRVLPAAAIKEALDERLDEFRVRMEQEPSRREKRRLKEETRDALLPQSLVKSDRMRGCFLLAEKILIVDAGSVNKAEWFIDHLRACFGPFDCVPLAYNTPPTELLTGLFLGDTRAAFSLGRECRMQDLSDSRSTVVWREVELADTTVRQHVVDGMKLTHLGVVYDDVLTCVLAEDGTVSKFKFLDADAADVTDDEHPLAKLDAEFVLLSGMARNMLKDLRELLGDYASDEEPHANAA